MLKSIFIQNFQSHKETRIEFHSGVNIVIGTSDSGKTAIIRALRWLMWNQPLGDSYRSRWGGDTTVTAEFSDFTVSRTRASKDVYTLTTSDGAVMEFKAFGTNVPEEIVKAFNMTKVNLQAQMDAPYLLSENPGEVARHFNRVAKIDLIDTGLKQTESWIRQIKGNVERLEDAIEGHEQTLKTFSFIPKLEKSIEALEGLQSQRRTLGQTIKGLTGIINSFQSVQEELKGLQPVLLTEQDLVRLDELFVRKRAVQVSYKHLETCLASWRNVKAQLEEYAQLISAEDSVLSLIEKFKQCTDTKRRINAVQGAIDALTRVDTDIDANASVLKELEERWHREFPETCPLCGAAQ